MASYQGSGQPAKKTGDGYGQAAASSDGQDGSVDAAIGRLPGVVNDLPEVAPHEWIYIMS